MPVKQSTSVENIADRAAGYGIPGVVVDGNDVLAVDEAFRAAKERALKGEGPTLIEAKTYRWRGHWTEIRKHTAAARKWMNGRRKIRLRGSRNIW